MALQEHQKEKIRSLVKTGELSNVQIAKEVGTHEKTIRNMIKKEGLVKSEFQDLAKREITNTIIGNEIKSEKAELSPTERDAYEEVLITKTQGLNLFNNTAIENQELVFKAQQTIKELIKEDPTGAALLEHLPNLMAIGKMTETNRKQLLGTTEAGTLKGSSSADESSVKDFNDFYK